MRIALVAHDTKKKDLIDWVKYNILTLLSHELISTGTTGRLVAEAGQMFDKIESLNVTRLKSGPLGGDQEIGSMIANGEIDMLIFFTDPLDTHVHADDIRALQRLAILYNIPVACNKATADYIISSSLFSNNSYQREIPNFDTYVNREI